MCVTKPCGLHTDLWERSFRLCMTRHENEIHVESVTERTSRFKGDWCQCETLISFYSIRNDTSNRKFIVHGAMSVSLFCQLSGPLVEGEEYLDNMILTLNLQMAYMLSSDTAIAWVKNQATAASIVLKGELLLLWNIPIHLADIYLDSIADITTCRQNQFDRLTFSSLLSWRRRAVEIFRNFGIVWSV